MATAQSKIDLKSISTKEPVMQEAEVDFGREICGALEVAEQREWLVTNGIGGFASGTVSGNLTRRYHGLLVAALDPPVGRMQLVAKLDETARYNGADYALATNRWESGAVEPKGYLNIESFRLDGITPVWRFEIADALIERRVWMQHGENTTYVRYTLLRGSGPLDLQIKSFVNYRDFHSSTHAGDWRMNIAMLKNGVQVTAFDGATPFYLLSTQATVEPQQDWYRNCFLPQEKYRGLDDREDHLLAAVFRATLEPNQSILLVLSTNAGATIDGARAHGAGVGPPEQPARAVIVKRRASRVGCAWMDSPTCFSRRSIHRETHVTRRAGWTLHHRRLPLVRDWGRDMMIALPGLTLTTGRADIARKILLAFARYVDGGMLPNNFPDAGGRPDYNTVDAALWFFEAVRQYFAATQDTATLRELFSVMTQMISAHLAGTRYQIHVDESETKSAMATRRSLPEGVSPRPGRSAKYCGHGARRLANGRNFVALSLAASYAPVHHTSYF